ncbi:MAG: TonB-dependent receptor [Acidobacteriia bacterium]|nr:TonB-dependent receptor [Terriglobia bacterium]
MKTLLSFLALTVVAFSQSDRGRIAGRALDPSGASVPSATITVLNRTTEAKRQIVSAADGSYAVDGLLSATYTITASAPGFADAVVSDLPLSVGQSRTLDLHFQPATVKESVTVSSGGLAEVETSSASIGANVSSREVAELPLNGRLMSRLYLLVPGASSSGSGTFDDMRFSGRAAQQNTLRYDGVQAGSVVDDSPNNAGDNSTQYRLSQSLENVQEFRIEATTYSAEYGRGSGGQITIVTKTGTNELHGGMFEYVRNNYFDARNYFNPVGLQSQAPLRLNQFGGSLGGAIKKDKLFFFLSNENMYQRVYVPFSQDTLSAFARSQAVPAIQPLLAAFPVGNAGPTSSPYFDRVQKTLASSVNENFGSARFDYHINDSNTVYVRFGREQGSSFTPNDVSGSGSSSPQTAQNGVADLTTIISPSMVNDLKFGINLYKGGSLTQGVTLPGLDLSNVLISIGGAAQSGATGIVTPRGAGSTPITQGIPKTAYEFTYIDNLSWTHGAHNFKAGIEWNPRGYYIDQLGATAYTFTNVQNFLANVPSQVNVTSTVSDASIFFNGATGVRHAQQWFIGGFFQDEWKVRPNFTINAGLRYDYFSPLFEAHDMIVSVNPDTGKINASGNPGFRTSRLNFGPRVGFAWSPQRFHEKTVLRIGAGYYYGPGQGEDQFQQILNDSAAIQLTSGISYPVNPRTLIAAFDPTSPNAQFTPRVYASGYNLPEKILSYSASIQQTLPDQSVLTVAYVGSQGRNEFQRTIGNLITDVTTNPTTGVGNTIRQFGNQFGEFDVKTTFGSNHYNALQVGLNHRFAKGLTGSLSYTWSHNIGTSGGSNEATTSENNYSFASQIGNISSDMRHVLNGSALYQLPFGRGQKMSFGGSRLADAILGGWGLGGNLSFHTGLPVNVLMQRNNVVYFNPNTGNYTTNPVASGGHAVSTAVINVPGGGQSRGLQRPDVVPGVDPYVRTSNGFWLNPAAFSVPKPGTYGNLGYNALTGPGFAQLDTSVAKRFPVTERVNLELRGEIYNILNHPNFSNPTANLGGGLPASAGSGLQPGQAFTTTSASSSFGFLGSTVGQYINNGTARQIQVALRLSF